MHWFRSSELYNMVSNTPHSSFFFVHLLLTREDDEPQIEEQERTILPEIDQTSAQKKEQLYVSF